MGSACAVAGLSVGQCVRSYTRVALLQVAGKFHSRSFILSTATVKVDNSAVNGD